MRDLWVGLNVMTNKKIPFDHKPNMTRILFYQLWMILDFHMRYQVQCVDSEIRRRTKCLRKI